MKRSFVPRLGLVLFLLVSLLIGLTPSRHAQATPAANGCWYYRKDMPRALRARAAVEADGKIYVIGGIAGDEERVADVDVYDPAADSWSSGPSLGYPRAWLTASAVDGKVYAVGGHVPLDPAQPRDNFTKVNWVQEYTPGDPGWVLKTPDPAMYSRDDAAAAVLDDKIYVMGGYGADYLNIAEIYDPISDTSTMTTPMPYQLAMGTGGAISNTIISNTIFVMGGIGGSGATSHTLAYNTVNDAWSEKADMPTDKSRAASGTINDLIYVIGGYNTTEGRLDVVERYDPGADGWATLNWMPTKRSEVAAAVVGDTIYVFGGRRSWDGMVISYTQAFDTDCEHSPPNEPVDPSPGSGWTNQPLDTVISWPAVADPDGGEVTYDVYFGEAAESPSSTTPPQVSTGKTDTTYDPPGFLKPDTRYYWQVVAIDNEDAVTTGERWTFVTGSLATMTKAANPTTVSEPGGSVEFTVEITNDADGAITIESLVDDVHGDLDGKGTCSVPQTIGVGNTYACSFSDNVPGNAGETETDTVTAAVNPGSGAIDITASATVTVTDALPNVTVSKTADPTNVSEPSGTVEFTVDVRNDGGESVTLDSLVDDVHGNLDGQGGCSVPQTINGAATYSCSFSATVSGNAGESETDTVTATVSDDEDNVAAESDSATVTIDDVTPTISLTVTSSAGPIYPGDAVDFTYRVDNLSAEPVTLTGLDDSVFGDLSSECSLPAGIAGNGYFDCVINRTLNADHISTATATAEDDEANEGTATAQASANVIAPAIQVEIQPDVSIAYAGQTIIYRYTVENTGEVDLHSVSATDDRLGAITLDKSSLVPGEVASGTATDVVDAGDVPGEYVNNVTAAGTSPSETVVTDIDTATVRLVHAIFLPLVRASAGTAAQSVEPVSIAYSEGKAPMPDLIAMILSTFTAGFAGKAPH